jgi:hypothetical protein
LHKIWGIKQVLHAHLTAFSKRSPESTSKGECATLSNFLQRAFTNILVLPKTTIAALSLFKSICASYLNGPPGKFTPRQRALASALLDAALTLPIATKTVLNENPFFLKLTVAHTNSRRLDKTISKCHRFLTAETKKPKPKSAEKCLSSLWHDASYSAEENVAFATQALSIILRTFLGKAPPFRTERQTDFAEMVLFSFTQACEALPELRAGYDANSHAQSLLDAVIAKREVEQHSFKPIDFGLREVPATPTDTERTVSPADSSHLDRPV